MKELKQMSIEEKKALISDLMATASTPDEVLTLLHGAWNGMMDLSQDTGLVVYDEAADAMHRAVKPILKLK
jgi:hypothetical protein